MIEHNSVAAPRPDFTSAFFIKSEMFLGLNRISILKITGKRTNRLFFVYGLFANILVVSLIMTGRNVNIVNIKSCVGICEYLCITIFGYILRDRLMKFYDKLQYFDTVSGCMLTETHFNRRIVLYSLLICSIYVLFFTFLNRLVVVYVSLHLLPLRVTHVLELHFYGYLMSLVRSRLRLLVDGVASALDKNKNGAGVVISAKLCDCNGNTGLYLELYHYLLDTYVQLFEAIKWQFFAIIITSFVGSICVYYELAMSSIEGIRTESFWVAFSYVLLSFVNSVPLFTPSIIGSRLKDDVKELRNLLVFRLQTELSKEDRSMTRALMYLTNVNNFSKSLMGAFPIDNTFPLKFMSLTISYMVILLQFLKVTNSEA